MVGNFAGGSQAAVAQKKSLRVAEVRMAEKNPGGGSAWLTDTVVGWRQRKDGQQVGVFFLLTRFIDGLQLRRAISIQAEGTRLLEKHAIAPSAARLCFMKGRQGKKTILLAGRPFFGCQPLQRTRKLLNSRRQGSFLPSSPQQL
jgi:hypothetical protein